MDVIQNNVNIILYIIVLYLKLQFYNEILNNRYIRILSVYIKVTVIYIVHYIYVLINTHLVFDY